MHSSVCFLRLSDFRPVALRTYGMGRVKTEGVAAIFHFRKRKWSGEKRQIVTNTCHPRRLLELSDVVCPNETELALLCKGEINPENDESIKAGARELIARGTKKPQRSKSRVASTPE